MAGKGMGDSDGVGTEMEWGQGFDGDKDADRGEGRGRGRKNAGEMGMGRNWDRNGVGWDGNEAGNGDGNRAGVGMGTAMGALRAHCPPPSLPPGRTRHRRLQGRARTEGRDGEFWGGPSSPPPHPGRTPLRGCVSNEPLPLTRPLEGQHPPSCSGGWRGNNRLCVRAALCPPLGPGAGDIPPSLH